jgi:hypothetical protein
VKTVLKLIPYAAKAIVGALVSGGAVPVLNAVAENTVIWTWEYMLASVGVGASVYLIPNKTPQEGHDVDSAPATPAERAQGGSRARGR